METIICMINLFELNQHLYKYNEETKSFISIGDASLESLGEAIATKCKEYGVNNVHIYGSGSFLDKTFEDIKYFGKNNYDFNDINVEVN